MYIGHDLDDDEPSPHMFHLGFRERRPNLPTHTIPTKILRLELSGKFPMDMITCSTSASITLTLFNIPLN